MGKSTVSEGSGLGKGVSGPVQLSWNYVFWNFLWVRRGHESKLHKVWKVEVDSLVIVLTTKLYT